MSRTVSPVSGKPFGLALVCRIWRVPRATEPPPRCLVKSCWCASNWTRLGARLMAVDGTRIKRAVCLVGGRQRP